MMQKQSVFKIHIALFLLLCLGAGILFAFVLHNYWNSIQYKNISLVLPFSPFFLYAFCGISYLLQGAAFVIIAEHPKKKAYKTAVWLFWLQFILMFFWPGIFFGMKLFGTALLDLFIAFISLLLSFSAFRKINISAAYLLFPYGCLLALIGVLNIWFFIV